MKINYGANLRWCLLSAVATAIAAPNAFAQSALEEIVVTAQKREESVQDVPIAVSVLSSETIDSAHAIGFEGLQQLIPSVSFRKGNTNRNSTVVVRGIGTISFSTAAEPSVSTVVDGVVLGRSGQAFTDLYDLERLEVLRGPQGTLFGKNASAGVVNMTTKRPTDEFTGSVDVSVFEDNERRVKGRFAGPLSDNARASLTVFDGSFDGYIENTFTGQTTNGYDRSGLRGMLEWDISDSVELLLIAEDYSSEDNCCADLEALPSGRNPSSPAAPNSQGIVNGVADIDFNQRRVDHDLETSTVDDHSAFSVQFEAEVGDYTLTSITATREWDNTEVREGDFTSNAGDAALPVDFSSTFFQLHDLGIQSWDQFSQELRIASPSDQRITWQAGLFYWNIESDRSFRRDASCQVSAANDPILAANPGLTCLANDIVAATAVFDTEFENFSVFGQGSAELTDSLSLIFGLRYTDDEVSFNHRRTNNDPFGRQGVGVRATASNTDFANQTSATNTSGKLGLQWQVNDAGMAYATYSQGYKGPAFNTFYNMAESDTLPIGEETSNSYEIGYKLTADSFFANLALFKTDIEGFQANNFDDSSGVTITRLTNAGDVSTQGLELDFIWQASENWQLSGGLAYVDAVIDRFNCPLDVAPGACTSRNGLDVPFSPDLKYTLSSSYVIPLASMDVIFNGSFVHMDEQVSDLPGNNGTVNPAALLPGYDMFNASVAFSFSEGKYVVTLIGKNLGDESYVTTYSGDNFRYQIPRDAERYFGISFKADF
ncbi:TonB-dependent receptor [Arenicella xantha]|uniref:Iron complex outermembrane receptor protein n=1 Tax=Arenicella xantha TaxID=644221 RepID=A0A395JFJ5_9GAMM|nr:TonB-dependent receptor [Arenicella xantha]RBP48573.1 iron complex outermembrane receptor protein [Arenicella xantha]